jgi:RHS repeat-associated protein
MKRPYLTRLIIGALIFLSAAQVLKAGPTPPVIKVLDGSHNQIRKDSFNIVQDSLFFDTSYNSKLVKPYWVHNMVTLKIDEFSPYYYQGSAFLVTVKLKIYRTFANLTMDSVIVTLTANYATSGVYNNRNTYTFDTAYRVKIVVMDTTSTASWNVWKVLKVENQLQSFPVFNFSCTANAITSVSHTTLPSNTLTDELPVNWGNVISADLYDLEWTYLDSSALSKGRYGDSTHPDSSLVFDNNTTRVTITSTSYNIPLMYDGSGSLFFRVRPVQIQPNGGRSEAHWSSDFFASGGLGRFDYKGHQRNLNWQATTTFAEEGKRKVLVQYYDGSLRSRQTVTKDNSTFTTVVAETFYDYQGRPAIQVMPAPTLKTVIGYSPNFNIGPLGSAYDKSNFDSLIGPAFYCSTGADSMKTDSGAALYYSPKDSLSNTGFNRFIPSTHYPFSQTQYTQDNTGRISSQGGVDSIFQLGQGYETKYFYGTPDQRQLDALFGTEVGDHSHYYKTMVKDANSQYSISFSDMHGRTIATALAGTPPSAIKLDKLPSNTSFIVTEKLSDSTSMVIKDLVMESKKGLLVPVDSNYTFLYSLNPQILQLPNCSNKTVCYNCLYDLEIIITDDCNNQKLGGQAFDTLVHNFTLVDTSCSLDTGFSFSFIKYLQQGSYEVTKKLSVSRYGDDYYRDSFFLKTNTCKTIDSFVLKQRQIQAGITQCMPTCQSCKDSLGTWSSYRAKYIQRAGIAAVDSAQYDSLAFQAYLQAQADCRNLCDSLSEYEDVTTEMLLDMTAASGQYANPDSSKDQYSIFYTKYDVTGHSVTLAPAYTRVSGYVNEDGKLDSVYDETTSSLVYPQQLSPVAFVNKFKLSWAQTLLQFHPEYCKLTYYQQLQASTIWDHRFEETDSYLQAMRRGYLNPTHNPGMTFTRYNATDSSVMDYDPIDTLSSHNYKTALEAQITNYTASGASSNQNISLWALASAEARCRGKDSSCYLSYTSNASAFDTAAMCTADLDMAWRHFRQMYLDIKRKVINDQIKSSICTSSVSSTVLMAAGHQPHFSDAAELLLANGLTLPSTRPQADASKLSSQGSEAAYYNSNCQAYVTQWWLQLKSCYSSTDSAVIIPQLIQVCEKGSDGSHPFGSSTISPDSSYTYKSFQDVIQAYNTAHGIVDTSFKCNAYRITSPKPYNGQVAYNNQPFYGKPDTCTCNRIAVLYNQFQAKQASYSNSFSNYLLTVYGTTMSTTDLNTLLSSCVLPSTSSCTNLTTPIQLPPLLQCNTGEVCITCEQYKTYNDKFKSQYPGVSAVVDSLTTDSSQINKNQLFAAFMNNQFGFIKRSNDYLLFFSACSTRLAQDSTNLTLDTCKRYTFIKNYGGSGSDIIADVHQTFDGGYILAGNTTSFGNGNTDAYVIKTDIRGNILWSKTYGGAAADNFSKIRQTADSGYIAIGTTKSYHQSQGEIFVVKMKPNGDVMWSRGLYQGTTNGEYGYDIIQTSEKGYAITGLYNFSAGVDDFEVIKLDSNGTVTWGEKFGSRSSDNLGGIVERSDTLFMAGFFYSSAVNVKPPPFTYYDAFLCKINKATGSIVWAKSYDISSKSNWVFGLTITPVGYRLNTFNSDDFLNSNPRQLAFDVDRSGIPIRAKQMTFPGGAIATTSSFPTFDSGYIFSQGYADTTFGDPFLHKVDASGNVTWTNRIRRTGVQYLSQIFQNSDSSFGGAGGDGNHALLLKTSRWGKTYCSDTTLNYPGINLTDTTYLDTMAVTSLGFTSPAITVIGINSQTIQTDICSYDPCTVSGGYGLTLCGRAAPIFPPVITDSINNCSDSAFFIVSKSSELFKIYGDSLHNIFDSSYRSKCMQAYKYESFTVTHASNEYHYTLYYYDQAGNLVKTIPPSGVDLSKFGWESSWSDSVTTSRNNNQTLVPAHTLVTNYRYNTLNQPMAQKSPDGGLSNFWYDRLGRLAISQNAKQKSASGTETGRPYSYTLYDSLGRINEVGQISNAGSTPMADSISRNPSILNSWLVASAANKEQITQTVYDSAYAGFIGISPQPITQHNLRNRVSYTSFTVGNNAANYNQSSFFNYDIEGNVDTLLQDYGSQTFVANQNMMNMHGHRWKKFVYAYDLISGKVNTMTYQPGFTDGWVHRYSYDAENRITQVQTSHDTVTWETDARYQYYKHGPLARMILGDQLVQGIDYAYTLEGWLKGVNSIAQDSLNDMGNDGMIGGTNQFVARDAYGFNLNYFTNDYRAINPTTTPFPTSFSFLPAGAYKPLYNGNINSIAMTIGVMGGNGLFGGATLLYNYTYDQLNRITGMDVSNGFSASGNQWNSLTTINQFRERLAYDPNGNILKYKRNGSNFSGAMDSLGYHYYAGSNKLSYISDSVPSGSNGAYLDLNNQTNHSNYKYDSIGNMISDTSEGVTNIKWSVYGKILEIIHTPNTADPATDILYSYDGAGNRISKITSYATGTKVYTWYVRDAQGNLITVYGASGSGTLSSLVPGINEWYMYGSSRLGSYQNGLGMGNGPQNTNAIHNWVNVRGAKQYELTNHLGNLIVNLTDKKFGVTSDSITKYFKPDVVNAWDYYVFGVGMPQRIWVNSGYRFGFNGKEKDDDVKSYGRQIDYGNRIYDPRVGRFLSVDPQASKLPGEGPYSAMGNNPILNIDPDGKFTVPVHQRITKQAFLNSGLGKGFLNRFYDDLYAGVRYADWYHFYQDKHFDNRKSFQEVQKAWDVLDNAITLNIKDIGEGNKQLGGFNVENLGIKLHSVQDFYSHSNYVELYTEYYKAANNGAIPTVVPIYNEGVKIAGFKALMERTTTDENGKYQGLHSGEFSIGRFIIDEKIKKKDMGPNSHKKMNKDEADTLEGKLAEDVATRHTTEILKRVKEKQ